MSNLTPVSSFDPVFQLETTTVAIAGPGGVVNAQGQALANRTEWLRQQMIARETELASGAGASEIGFVDPVSGSEPRTVFSILSERKRVTSLRRASDPDWTLAFQRAAASGAKNIVVAGGTYDVDAAFVADIQSGQYWEFDGATVNHPRVNGVFLRAQNVDDWGITGQVLVVGAGAAAQTGAGLHVLGANRFRVEGFGAKNIAGWGIKHDPGTPSGTLRGDQGVFVAPQLHACYRGFENTADTGAEYSTILAPIITGCNVGLKISAGNTIVIGGNAVENTTGIMVVAGSNHAHGIVSGMNVNHNTLYGLHCVQVTNGQTFADCHFYGNGGGAGAIFLDRCNGVTLDGGILDAWVYNYTGTGSGYNFIRNMNCPGSYGAVVRADATSAVPAELVMLGNYGAGAYADGFSINDPAPVYVNATRAAAATQAVTAGTTLLFPTEAANGDRRRAFDAATGIFTVPADMEGQYEIKASLYFTGTGLVANNHYVEFVISGGTPSRVFTPSAFGSTLLTCQANFDVYLTAGQTVRVNATIDGTTKFFGGATYVSSLSIKRVA